MANIFISVIVPAYNCEKFIINCLKSILNQTFKDFECIIINDGSTDNTVNLCNEFCSNDNRFKVIHIENKGVSNARNTGIQYAKGEYICFVDSDDLLIKDKLKICYNLAKKKKINFILHAVQVNVNNVQKTIWNNIKGEITPKDLLVFTAHKYDINSCFNKLYKRSIILKHNIVFNIHINFGEDLLFNIHYFFVVLKIYCINTPLYIYNRYNNENSLSTTANTLSDERRLNYIKGFKGLLYKINKLPYFSLNKDLMIKYFHELSLKPRIKDKIDYVFPFVNCNDKNWLILYSKYRNFNNKSNVRFGTYDDILKYKFRSIEKYMPWINIIHFIVMSPSLIPDWLDRSKVNIVYHYEIMPKDKLPVFNSSAIEMYINNIIGLSNRFIYSNDDIYANNYMSPEDFFENNKANIKLKKIFPISILKTANLYYIKNSLNLAIKNATTNYKDIKKDKFLYEPLHVDKPMMKNENLKFYNKHKKIIDKSVTKFRDKINFNQGIWTLNLYFHGLTNNKCITYECIKLKKNIDPLIYLDINDNRLQELCLNDTEETSENMFINILNKLNELYPNKSKYEL